MSTRSVKVVQIEAENSWKDVAASMVRVIASNLEWLTNLKEDNNLHIVLPNGTGVRVDQFSPGTLAVMPGFGYTEKRGELNWSASLNGVMVQIHRDEDDHKPFIDTDRAEYLTRLSVMRAQKGNG